MPDATLGSGTSVILVFDTLELGGAERQGLLLARYMRDECSASVEIWGLTGAPGRLSRLCDEHGIRWRAVELAWSSRVADVARNLAELGRLTRLLRTERPNMILPYTFFSNVMCGLVWRLTGAELCVWNQRDVGFYLDGVNPWRSLAARLTPYFIANSAQGRHALIQAFAKPDRVTVIHNGVELAQPQLGRRAWREQLGANDDDFAVCMVSNVHANKDHATLLRAWRHVLDHTLGTSPVLLLAGRVEEQGQPLRQLAETLALGATVRFLGEVDDVAGLLGAVDLCVHSSRTEGLPNAVLEAMAAGLPVVATDLPGIREAVGPDGERFLVGAGDAKALGERILELAGDPALRGRIGEALQRRAREHFDPATMCRTTVRYLASKWQRKR
jgi:glycosyltransferase involved in cell wall biosynthesis